MPNLKRDFRWVILLVSLLLLMPLVATAQTPQNSLAPYPSESGPDYDARMYAAYYGVSIKEAKRRFHLQNAAGDLNAQLLNNESTTFAGLWLEHKPTFRVVVQFAGIAKHNIATYTQNKELASIVEVRTAKTALIDLEKAQVKALSSFARNDIPIESGINVQKNRVELYVLAQDSLSVTAEMQIMQLPPFIKIITVPSMSKPAANIYGGLQLNVGPCTSGFSVKAANGVKGITTAGHCANTQVYKGKYLTYVTGLFKDYYDVQWNTAPGYTVTNQIQWSQSEKLRTITAVKNRSNQVINAYVCKYGIASFYTCGTISDKNYAPDYRDNAGNKIIFTPTFIRVAPTSGYNPLTKLGDSGGPWYIENYAYGINSGGGSYAIYMAINYISHFGISVLTAGVPLTPPP